MDCDFSKDHPFTFFDHNLKYGDAVVGCTKNQISTFDLDGVRRKFFASTISVKQGSIKTCLYQRKPLQHQNKCSERKSNGRSVDSMFAQRSKDETAISRETRLIIGIKVLQDLSDENDFIMLTI